MTRNETLSALKETVVFEEAKGMGLEKYQAATLRPILKFQNETLLTIFKQVYPTIAQLLTLPAQKKHTAIGNFLRKNSAFRNIIKGLVLGLMTTDELAIFYNQEAELTKRIHALATQRLTDQIGIIN